MTHVPAKVITQQKKKKKRKKKRNEFYSCDWEIQKITNTRSTHQILLCSKANEAQETNKLRHLKL